MQTIRENSVTHFVPFPPEKKIAIINFTGIFAFAEQCNMFICFFFSFFIFFLRLSVHLERMGREMRFIVLSGEKRDLYQ